MTTQTTSIPKNHSRQRSTDTRWQRDLRHLLNARRHLLQEALSTRPLDPDPIDAAHEQEEETLLVALLDYDQSVQSQVAEALARVESGEYTLCVDCGHTIPPARLQALPFALRCLPCQEHFEREAERLVRRQALWAA